MSPKVIATVHNFCHKKCGMLSKFTSHGEGRGSGNLCEVFFRLLEHQQWQKTSITKLLKMGYVSPDEGVSLL